MPTIMLQQMQPLMITTLRQVILQVIKMTVSLHSDPKILIAALDVENMFITMVECLSQVALPMATIPGPLMKWIMSDLKTEDWN